ncbi:MAG: LLM class flavin-dependent oxidoreductase, partial [Pseudomonadota bacterium]
EPERFDHEGRFFQVKAAFSQPKPVDCGLPMVVSAGSSPTGREFALTKADALFMVVPELDSIAENLAGVRLAMGPRPINVYCSGHIFCRATKQETEDYYHYLIHETGDWAAGRFLLKSYEEIHSMPREILHSDPFIERLMSGSGTLPVVGDPDHVVDTFKKLNAAGISGMAFALPNYLEDFKIIREEVLPRMEAAGLREPWV